MASCHPVRENRGSAVDGVLGASQSRCARQRAAEHSRRHPVLEVHHAGENQAERHAHRGDHHRQDHVPLAVLREGAEELGAGLQTHAENEQRKTDLAREARNLESQVAHPETDQQHAGRGPHLDAAELHTAEQVPQSDRQEGEQRSVARDDLVDVDRHVA
jgi:hypothetical protein